MLFALKKIVSFWLMPVPFCLVLLAVGFLFLRSPRRARWGRVLLFSSGILLAFFSSKPVSAWLIRPLESVYPTVPEFGAGAPVPANIAACRYVVVLGGGNADSTGFSATNRLSVSSRGRLVEALRVLHVLPAAKLILSGPGLPGRPTHAAVQAQAAISLGVDPARIIRIERARDTEDESAEVRRIVGEEPFVLVTSAWHMPRAMALMRHAGLKPVPCPADYMGRPPDVPTWTDYLWDLDALKCSSWAIRERLGYLWIRLRGKT